jgi:hypothetical protein
MARSDSFWFAAGGCVGAAILVWALLTGKAVPPRYVECPVPHQTGATFYKDKDGEPRSCLDCHIKGLP